MISSQFVPPNKTPYRNVQSTQRGVFFVIHGVLLVYSAVFEAQELGACPRQDCSTAVGPDLARFSDLFR